MRDLFDRCRGAWESNTFFFFFLALAAYLCHFRFVVIKVNKFDKLILYYKESNLKRFILCETSIILQSTKLETFCFHQNKTKALGVAI